MRLFITSNFHLYVNIMNKFKEMDKFLGEKKKCITFQN